MVQLQMSRSLLNLITAVHRMRDLAISESCLYGEMHSIPAPARWHVRVEEYYHDLPNELFAKAALEKTRGNLEAILNYNAKPLYSVKDESLPRFIFIAYQITPESHKTAA